jgi:hypothetical protein
MKTTLELPDELYRKAKATAALRGETLTALLAQALESVVAGRLRPAVEGAKSTRKRASSPADQERIKKWRDEEAAFLASMRGRDHEKKSAAEIVGERRR